MCLLSVKYRMIIRIACLLLLLILSSTSSVHAQGRIVTTSSESHSSSAQGFARDYWFSLLKNYQDAGKYFEVYVASPSSTVVYFSIGKAAPQHFPIGAMEVLVLRLPLAWEMTQSAVVEDKAIHVWSNDADFTISVLSRSPATADGLTVLPVSSWGKEYVVAAYASFAYYAQYDYPSEFSVVASEDNTIVTIKPSCDLREGLNPGVAFPRGQTFTVTLNRGQAVQYQATAANGNEEDHDVTGTIITSSKPIGVEAGVMLANVPASAPSGDHLCEMMLPVDRWGKTYYTAPFAKRKGGDGMLVIAAEDNTKITRISPSGAVTHAILNKFEPFIRFDIDEASQWTSDKPFMLVQYILGEDYPNAGDNQGVGAPSMMVIAPTSLYERSSLFQTPKLSPGSGVYTNYANFIVHKNAVNSTTLDGEKIAGVLSALPISGSDHIIYSASNLSPGSHFVSSDSGVGVSIYGYGWYESYAWPGPMGAFATSKTDSSSPVITSIADQCYTSEVRIADLGSGATGDLIHSIDTTANIVVSSITYIGDKDSVSYRITVLDSSRDALARLTFADGAGNRRTIEHTYTPDLPQMPEGVYVLKVPMNTSVQFALPIAAGQTHGLSNINARLKGNTQFQIFNSPLAVDAGEIDSIRFFYNQPSVQDFRDTLVVSADCWHHEIALRGSPTPLFGYEVKDTVINFGLVVVGDSRSKLDLVYNVGTEPFTVDSIVLEPTEDFSLVTGQFPQVVPMGDTVDLTLSFAPKSEGQKNGRATVYTSLGSTSIRLVGEGKGSLYVSKEEGRLDVQLYPNPATDLLKVSMSAESRELPSSWVISSVDGKQLLTAQAIPAEERVFYIDTRTLPGGVYVFDVRLVSGKTVTSKFTIQR
jgi:hypothetical protein